MCLNHPETTLSLSVEKLSSMKHVSAAKNAGCCYIRVMMEACLLHSREYIQKE